MQEKAMDFAKSLELGEDFKASNGWFQRWKKRFLFTDQVISGESVSVTPEMIAGWKETTLPTILSQYELKDIFNADEFGLFYQMLPNRSLSQKGKTCSGGKQSKVRLTGMAAASAMGEKLPMFVIGKYEKPRCFKGIRNTPCRYRSQKKAWMDLVLFEEWVREMDKHFQKEDRKICLIIDNCPAHCQMSGLSNIRIEFLQPNTTSKSQPMDQGVIRSLKAKYRRHVIRKFISSLDAGKGLPTVSILEAMLMLTSAWGEVTRETVQNCFLKVGISTADKELAMSDDDDPFKLIEEDLSELVLLAPTLLPENTTPEDLVQFDDETSVAKEGSSDEEIIAWATNKEEDESDDEEECVEVIEAPKCPTSNKLMEAVDLIRQYSYFSEESQDALVKISNDLESIVLKEKTKRKKQVSIVDFFMKK